MVDCYALVRLTDAELARLDIAVMNLLCAAGLPGSDKIDLGHCLRTLDGWAHRCRAFTEKGDARV